MRLKYHDMTGLCQQYQNLLTLQHSKSILSLRVVSTLHLCILYPINLSHGEPLLNDSIASGWEDDDLNSMFDDEEFEEVAEILDEIVEGEVIETSEGNGGAGGALVPLIRADDLQDLYVRAVDTYIAGMAPNSQRAYQAA
jgi:hypothetical protein